MHNFGPSLNIQLLLVYAKAQQVINVMWNISQMICPECPKQSGCCPHLQTELQQRQGNLSIRVESAHLSKMVIYIIKHTATEMRICVACITFQEFHIL